MDEVNKHPTPYPQINVLLNGLLSRADDILGENLIGMYLYGSLAFGDFDPDRSDVDFIVVTNKELSEPIISELEKMHVRMWASGSKWMDVLEGVYMPKAMLRKYDRGDPPIPTVNEGRFYLAQQGYDWVIQRYILREHETIVAGPRLKDCIDPVRPVDLQRAIKALLLEWWEPMQKDPGRLKEHGYQPYAVLSMCRSLYTLEHGSLASKTAAAAWAKDVLDDYWHDLIQDAINWKSGSPVDNIDRTIELIGYVIDRSRQIHLG